MKLSRLVSVFPNNTFRINIWSCTVVGAGNFRERVFERSLFSESGLEPAAFRKGIERHSIVYSVDSRKDPRDKTVDEAST
jgi:hypothetical protein